MEEVPFQSLVAGGADLLMECEEEELEVWPQSPGREEEEEREEEQEEWHDEAVEEQPGEEEKSQLRILPIPSDPAADHCVTQSPAVKCAAAPPGFKVNGRLILPLPPTGAELKLCLHPRGSASGFTTVLVPDTLTAHRAAGTSSSPRALPAAVPTPVITGVVSGEAAQRVLTNHSKGFTCTSTPPVMGSQTPPSPPRRSRQTPPVLQRPAVPQRLLSKGQLKMVSPPDCPVCMSHYKLITDLRGFMCLCSPAIAQSLRNLKKKRRRQRWRSRDKNRTCRTLRESQAGSKVSRTAPGPGSGPGPGPGQCLNKSLSPLERNLRPSEDFLPDGFNAHGFQQEQCEHPPEPPKGKLVIMVEDFYYGSAPGQRVTNPNTAKKKYRGPYHCIHCPKMLCNNIKLMSHAQEHVSTVSLPDGHMDTLPSCPHCFRPFLSSVKLQRHLDAVHSRRQSAAQCKICELAFDSEPAFLRHMKVTHKPGEMPYICQVCDFRSSFHSDLRCHFEQHHADSCHLLCVYCLRVLSSSSCYQQHVARHQRKHVFSCDKCRLHFLFVRERIEHKLLHHRTHIRPPQLSGLRPGTKVTVRTYSVVGGSEDKKSQKQTAPCKVVDIDPPPPAQEASTRGPVQTLGTLLSNLSQDRVSQRCVECLSWIQDFSSHFPSLVRCSLCRFLTCCSTSYANHMINNHAARRQKPQYLSVFQSGPRLSQSLKCVSCSLTTCQGDLMANHLTDRPEHHCILLTHTESGFHHDDRRTTRPPDSCSVVTSVGKGEGAFVPIHLLSSTQNSTQLSVKPLSSQAPLPSPPAMVVKFLGPRPLPEQRAASPLSASQLAALLLALCRGLRHASRHYSLAPPTIRSWSRQQEARLLERAWHWQTEKLAEWLLTQREQQLSAGQDVLLQIARKALGEDGQLTACYCWIVDFLLRHDLGVQPLATGFRHLRTGRLPRNIRDNSYSFIHLLSAQVQSRAPHLVASMDEFSVFVDLERFSAQNPAALRLSGSPDEEPVFTVVLSAVAEGTFLPPLLFFRGTLSKVPDGFPDNVLLEARPEGFSDQDLHRIWISKVWRPHMSSQQESLLVVDVHHGHLTDEFRRSLSSTSTNVLFIPSGCACRLQPLDVCVTPALRDFLQARWTQLVSQGGLDGLGLDQLSLTLACWLSEVSFTLNSGTDFLRRSFASVCNRQALEDREEAASMTETLTEALALPPDTCRPPPVLQPQLQLEVLIEGEARTEEVAKEEHREKGEEELLRRPSALQLVFEGDSDEESFHEFHDD